MPGIAYSISITLPGIVNLPTFFRHARSRSHAFLALTFITFFTACIESAGIWLFDPKSTSDLGIDLSFANIYIVILFIALSLFTTNLVNIYFASAAWESIVPKLKGNKKFAIVGMAGTVAFTFVQIDSPLFYIENMLDSFIGSLGIVVIMSFLVKRVVSHRERGYEMLLSGVSWLAGCLASFFAQTYSSVTPANAFFTGIGVSVLTFLLIIFVEETIWSYSNSFAKTRKHKG